MPDPADLEKRRAFKPFTTVNEALGAIQAAEAQRAEFSRGGDLTPEQFAAMAELARREAEALRVLESANRDRDVQAGRVRLPDGRTVEIGPAQIEPPDGVRGPVVARDSVGLTGEPGVSLRPTPPGPRAEVGQAVIDTPRPRPQQPTAMTAPPAPAGADEEQRRRAALLQRLQSQMRGR